MGDHVGVIVGARLLCHNGGPVIARRHHLAEWAGVTCEGPGYERLGAIDGPPSFLFVNDVMTEYGVDLDPLRIQLAIRRLEPGQGLRHVG